VRRLDLVVVVVMVAAAFASAPRVRLVEAPGPQLPPSGRRREIAAMITRDCIHFDEVGDDHSRRGLGEPLSGEAAPNDVCRTLAAVPGEAWHYVVADVLVDLDESDPDRSYRSCMATNSGCLGPEEHVRVLRLVPATDEDNAIARRDTFMRTGFPATARMLVPAAMIGGESEPQLPPPGHRREIAAMSSDDCVHFEEVDRGSIRGLHEPLRATAARSDLCRMLTVLPGGHPHDYVVDVLVDIVGAKERARVLRFVPAASGVDAVYMRNDFMETGFPATALGVGP
jgi:hypothetical protein